MSRRSPQRKRRRCHCWGHHGLPGTESSPRSVGPVGPAADASPGLPSPAGDYAVDWNVERAFELSCRRRVTLRRAPKEQWKDVVAESLGAEIFPSPSCTPRTDRRQPCRPPPIPTRTLRLPRRASRLGRVPRDNVSGSQVSPRRNPTRLALAVRSPIAGRKGFRIYTR